MIRATIAPEWIKLEGHAGAGPHGYDIVCAAVSALVQTFVIAVEDLTTDELEKAVEPDTGQIRAIVWGEEASDKTKLLVDAMWLGLNAIAQEYPENLQTNVYG